LKLLTSWAQWTRINIKYDPWRDSLQTRDLLPRMYVVFLLFPSQISYKPFSSFGGLAGNGRFIDRDFVASSRNFVALISGPRRSRRTSWLSSRDLVDLVELSGSRLGTSSISSNFVASRDFVDFVELRASHLETSPISSNFVVLVSGPRRSRRTSWRESRDLVGLRGSRLGTSSISFHVKKFLIRVFSLSDCLY
jgi:hypothetical protein